MKHILIFVSFLFLSLSGLTGCGVGIAAPTESAAQVELGTIRGSNFGGHAPVIGAHLYVLQAGTSGYGGLATSLLTSTSKQASYPTKANVNDPFIPTSTPWYYVTTDNSGAFNISGDYTCTPGLPVYLYAYGGIPTVPPTAPVTAYSTSGSTVTLTSSALLSPGQTVTFTGFGGTGVAGLNNGTYTITSEPSATTFTVTLSGASGSGSVAATVIPTTPINPNVVQLAVLGNCPTSGAANFSYLNYVYMNEVSTIAAAYSLSGFFTNSSTDLTSVDAVHLSIPIQKGQAGVAAGTSPAWQGIQQAATNAAVLYDIQGSVVGTGGDGEGHIANSAVISTPNNGVVPQALINTMANVLATCVDSGSTAASTSPACTKLFSYLGSTVGAGGVPSGTAPKDTATAAIDMAHNPGNSNATAILGLPTTLAPFAPVIVPSSSKDLMIGITWLIPSGEQAGSYTGGQAVGSTAVDAAGNIWLGSYQPGTINSQGYVLQYDNNGNQLLAKQLSYNPDFLALDNSNNLWVLPNALGGSASGIYKYTGTNFGTSNYYNGTTLNNPESFAIDGSNNVYITSFQSGESIKLNSSGSLLCTYDQNTAQAWAAGLDKSGNFWMGAWGQGLQEWTVSNCNKSGGNNSSFTSPTAITNPQVVAFDQSGNAWVTDRAANSTTPVTKVVPGSSTQTSYTGGGLNNHGATALAVDGDSNIIVGSWTSPNLLTILDSNGNFLTTTNGLTGNYQVSGSSTTTVTTEGSWFFAMDGSGNLWSNGPTQLHEYIGIGAPVLTPNALQVKNGTAAAKP